MRTGLLLLALCVILTDALVVPRLRRAVPTEELPAAPVTAKQQAICAPQTPCAWSIYDKSTRVITKNITNTYCICDPSQRCFVDVDDLEIGAYAFRCRTSSADEEDTVES